MRRFFYHIPNTLKVGEVVELSQTIFHHWCKVLRAKVGDRAVLFDGLGGEYTATLQQIDKKSASVLIDSFDPINRNLPLNVNIGLVMSRGERLDYAITKACETGVRNIYLLNSQHSEVRLKTEQIDKKISHLQAVAVSACEQCGLNIVPVIYPPIDIGAFIQNSPTGLKLVLAVPRRMANKRFDFDYFTSYHDTDFVLLIGAEGGLSDDELSLAYEHDFLAWQIGERILRTETAPSVALTALQAWYQAKMTS